MLAEETKVEVEGTNDSFYDNVRVEKIDMEVEGVNVLDSHVRFKEPKFGMKFVMKKGIRILQMICKASEFWYKNTANEERCLWEYKLCYNWVCV